MREMAGEKAGQWGSAGPRVVFLNGVGREALAEKVTKRYRQRKQEQRRA